jgi:hypothetical protein
LTFATQGLAGIRARLLATDVSYQRDSSRKFLLHIVSTIDQIYPAGVAQLTFEVGETEYGWKGQPEGCSCREMPMLPPAK